MDMIPGPLTQAMLLRFYDSHYSCHDPGCVFATQLLSLTLFRVQGPEGLWAVSPSCSP